MSDNKSLHQHIVNLLVNDESHLDARAVLEQFPREFHGRRPLGAPYSPWEVLEHMRIAQWDILEFTVDPKHVSPKWPDECWPGSVAPPVDSAWDKSVKQFLTDLDSVRQLMGNPKTDLLARIPHGTGQTYLREAMLVADHNSYHLGQLVLLGKLLESENHTRSSR
jgi:hypothetical protein